MKPLPIHRCLATCCMVLSLLLLVGGSAEPARAEVLVQGSSYHGTNGVMFGPDGNLYVASVLERAILVLDPETGELLERIGTAEGVETPDDLAFGPDESLYWTAIVVGEVGRLSPEGIKTGQTVAPGVNPITFSGDGRLFVALDFLGDGLYELDPDLEDPPRLIVETLGFLNGMDWGADGFLYGPIWTQAQVVRVDVDTAEVTVVADGFGIPAAVKFDSEGRLHALDTLRGEIVHVDTATGATEVVATVLPGGDNLAFDAEDRLFVSSFVDGSIVEILEDDSLRTVSPGGMVLPMGVAVVPRGDGESVYVADYFSLREVDGATGAERSKAINFLGGELPSPVTVAVHGDHLAITSFFDNTVAVWDPATATAVETYHDLAVPMNAIGFEGDLIVAELGAEPGAARVVRQTAAGREVLADAAAGIFYPLGLAVDDGDLWVGDWATGMIWQLYDDGEQLTAPVVVAAELANPSGLAVDADGNLLTVEMGTATLARVDHGSGSVTRIASGLQIFQETPEFLPPTGSYPGVAVGPSGSVYVTGTAGKALYRYTAEELYACTPDATTLCLNDDRFKFTVTWEDFAGNTGVGQAGGLSDDTGSFWFFDEANLELVVKALDGRWVNDHFWVFYGSLTNVEFALTVRDTATGAFKTYANESGEFASTGDIEAFYAP